MIIIYSEDRTKYTQYVGKIPSFNVKASDTYNNNFASKGDYLQF
jgi:hypothetical protein